MIQRRTNYVKTKTVDDVNEKDFLLNSFSYFNWERPMLNYRMTYDDYLRPDLLSLKIYGTQEYWWIILKCNPGFDDIFNDFVVDADGEVEYEGSLKIDSLIKIPNILDIKDFITFNKTFIEQG